MSRIAVVLLTCIGLIVLVLLSASGAQAAVPTTTVSINPVNLQAGTSTQITYTLSNTVWSTVFINISDAGGNVVRSFVEGGKQPGVAHHYNWDGKDKDGNYVPTGTYTVTVQATAIVVGSPYWVHCSAVDKDGNIYVTNSGSYLADRKVYKLTPGSTSPVLFKDGFSNPWGIDVDQSLNVYVSDYEDKSITIFKPDGSVKKKITGVGDEGGHNYVDNPTGLAVNSTGYIYVADFETGKVGIYKSNGDFVTEHPFGGAIDVYIDSHDRVYVTSLYGKVEIFDTNWNEIHTFSGTHGSGTNQFDQTRGVGVDSSGKIYIADQLNYRIKVYDGSSYNYLYSIRFKINNYMEPWDICIDSNDNMYITDNSMLVAAYAPARASVTVIDTLPPVVTCIPSGTAGLNGWYLSDVTVNLHADDPSGIQYLMYSYDNSAWSDVPPSGNIVLNSEGITTVYWKCSDTLGQITYGNQQFKIDKIQPTLATMITPAAPNAYGWYDRTVQVNYTASDAISGVSSISPNVTLAAEGANQLVTGTATDTAGNQNTFTTTISIDKTVPLITGAQTTAANANGWYNGNVQVHFTASDALSGLASVTPDVVLATEGAGQSVQGTAVDKAGNTNSATVSGINIDLTKPVIFGATTRAPNGNGWYNGSILVHFTASDALSGLASVTPDTALAAEGASQSVTGTAIDNAGNTNSTTVSGINIDLTKPVITYTLVQSPNSNGWYNGNVLVHFTASDALSGVASVTPDITLTGGNAGQSVTGTAVDNAGNSNSTTVSGINIDAAAPVTTAVLSGYPYGGIWFKEATVWLSATDALSGVNYTEYRVNDGGWTRYAGPFTLSSFCTLSYRSMDLAGNLEDAMTQSLDIRPFYNPVIGTYVTPGPTPAPASPATPTPEPVITPMPTTVPSSVPTATPGPTPAPGEGAGNLLWLVVLGFATLVIVVSGYLLVFRK